MKRDGTGEDRKDRRREELRKAILRVKNKSQRISISSVAREAGVTPALLHNTYSDIAEEIRALTNKGSREQRDAARDEAARLRQENAQLRTSKVTAEATARQLASLNETLRHELAAAKAQIVGKVIPIRKPLL
jgi:transposase-like protein